MTKEMSDQYAAGIIEARGRLQTNQGGTRRPYRPMVTVHIADYRIVQALREHFDCGALDSFRPVSNPHLQIHVWSVKGAGAVGVLERIVPYMIGEVGEHVEYILERDRTRPSMNGGRV
jgi:hypothetical protein